VKTYFLTASHQGLSMATLHRKRAAVSEFGKWGVRQRYWDRNPVEDLPRIQRPKHLPRPFTRDEVDRLLALALPPREGMARALLFFTWLRVTPICSIKIGDVSADPPAIRVLVKGRRTQVVRAHPELRELLQSYILSSTDPQASSYLLAQRNGRPYSRRMLERLAHRWGQAAGVRACTPHRFRHTFATGLLQAGVDIRVIKEALGHRDIQSTMIYTQVADLALDAAIAKLPWGKPRPEGAA
jgi:integrase/recombinase XerD